MGQRAARFTALVCAFCLATVLVSCASGSSSSANTSSRTVESAQGSQSSESSQSAQSASSLPDLSFETKDIDGNPVSMGDFANAKVILVNLWEPWCGPCVKELPYLQDLYEHYADQGLVVIGAFTSTNMKSDVRDLIDEHGITYPVIVANSGFEPYQTRYVPTSMIFDGSGRPLIDEPLVGSRSYRQWEQLVLEYL